MGFIYLLCQLRGRSMEMSLTPFDPICTLSEVPIYYFPYTQSQMNTIGAKHHDSYLVWTLRKILLETDPVGQNSATKRHFHVKLPKMSVSFIVLKVLKLQ